MNDEIARIRETLDGSDFLQRSFPVLFHPGVKDEDVLIHSIGCSLWITVGHELGFSAVVEAPAPAAAGCDIRSDSVWFRLFGISVGYDILIFQHLARS